MNVEAIIRGFYKRAADAALNPQHPMNKPFTLENHIVSNTNSNADKLAPYIYHGAKSNMNSSMLLEGELRESSNKLKNYFLQKNPLNSLFIDSHGGGFNNEYAINLDKSVIPNQRLNPITPNKDFFISDIKDALKDKATNVHNLFFATCNRDAGCYPTSQMLNNFPNVTNIVASPPWKPGYVNDIFNIGMTGRRQFSNTLLNPANWGDQEVKHTDPVQYLKGTNGQWSTNTFKRYN